MGLLSKLFGEEVEKTVSNLANSVAKETVNLANQVSDGVKKYSENVSSNAKQTGNNSYSQPEQTSSEGSWDSIPSEPNQYNYSGSYEQYFESIFADKLGAYTMTKESNKWKCIAYTFTGGAGKALVIELLPESSSAKKLRDDCAKEGVPYLRFYYNHRGWWNTRSYVEGRILGALK